MKNQDNQITEALLVGIAVAAAMLGIAPKTLRNWLHLGRSPVPPVKLGARTVFRVADIQAFVDGLVPAVCASVQAVQAKRGPGRPRNAERRAA